MKITERQIIDVVKHLASNMPRQSGRTTIMAKAFIRASLESPGEKIYYFDHIPGVKHKSDMTKLINKLLNDNIEFNMHLPHFQLNADYLIYEPTQLNLFSVSEEMKREIQK